MILRRLRLHPFGFFADRQVSFAPGLNIVLGPNEAGKSTLFAAVKSSFLRTKLSKPKLEQHIGRYMPISGGDVVRVELELQAAGGTWLLRRRWGASPASELVLPAGGSLVDDDAISAKLESILPAKQGTFWKVLMTGQAELAATLAVLKKDASDALADLADILRTAVLEAGGVSVDRFLSRLAELGRDAFSHWDSDRGGPEKGRGIENPWQKEVGTILAAWYAAQRTAAEQKAALAWEKELDDVNGRIRAAAAAAVASEAFVADHRAAAADAAERRRWEAELRSVRLELDSWRKIAAEWPKAKDRIEKLKGELAGLDAAQASLAQEKDQAQREEQGRVLRMKHERVMRSALAVQEAGRKLVEVPPLEKSSLEELRLAVRKLDALAAAAEAGRLSVTVAGRNTVKIGVQEDFRPERTRTLSPDEVLRLTASGRLRILHPDLEIEVRSGDTGFEEKAEKAESARRAVELLLKKLAVSDLPEAETRAAAFAQLSAELTAAQRHLAEELEGELQADLEAKVAALGPSLPGRPLAVVAAELADAAARKDGVRRELDELSRRTAEWEAAYGTPSAVLERLGRGLNQEKELGGAISRSAPLPPGFADAAVFLRAYESAQAQAASSVEKRTALLREKLVLENRGPKESAEALAARLREAEEELQGQLRRGQALKRIADAAESLLSSSDAAVSAGMRAPLEKMIGEMTGGRHVGVRMEGALPSGLAGPDGGAMSWELLSAGTKDSLALALRLAMASWFLGDADGFLMMDDPLVDMDPARQKAAAAALSSFAASRQLILFTCHPSTAALFAGNLISL
ncbi:MAG: AAA family ATPase [Spirochaetia bacterium]